jgi:hypothetical protein
MLEHWFDSRFSEELLGRVEITRKNSLQPSVLLAFLLVSEEQMFTANFRYSEQRIEQMARKNHGASANPNTS